MIELYIVYRVWNQKIHKPYCAMHKSQDPHWGSQFACDSYRPTQKYLMADMQLYGAQWFTIEIVKVCGTHDEASQLLQKVTESHGENTYNYDDHDAAIERAKQSHVNRDPKTKPKSKRKKPNHDGFTDHQHTEDVVQRITEYRSNSLWVHNAITKQEKAILKTDQIPPGFLVGRLCRKQSKRKKQLKAYCDHYGIKYDEGKYL